MGIYGRFIAVWIYLVDLHFLM